MFCDKVVDIRESMEINPASIFAIDTNILYWYHYPRFDTVRPVKNAGYYIDFMDNLLNNDNILISTIHNFIEEFNVHKCDI